MQTAHLERFAHADYGTFGDLITPMGMHYATVERPWLMNKPRVSCIPLGEYTCKPRRFYRKGYDAIEITEVQGRTHILMHIANSPHELHGCVGINTSHGAVKHQWCGLQSKNAFNSLMDELGGKTFKLIITNRESGEL